MSDTHDPVLTFVLDLISTEIENMIVPVLHPATIADRMRERRSEMVRALYPDVEELFRDLGGKPRITTVAPTGFAPVAWVFPKEDA